MDENIEADDLAADNPDLFDVDALVFVRGRDIGFNLLSFEIHTRSSAICFRCRRFGTVLRTSARPLNEIFELRLTPFHTVVLCESCDAVFEGCAASNALPFPDVATTGTRIPLRWHRNDIRFSRTEGMAAGSLGVAGQQNGLLRDSHEWLESTGPSPAPHYHQWRQRYRDRYGYSIPSAAGLDVIERYAENGLIDFGAGNGYWSFLLRQRGRIHTIPVEPKPVDLMGNAYFLREEGFSPFSWTEVVIANEMFLKQKGNGEAMLLSWPPPNCSMAASALDLYQGDTLIYVGVENSTCGTPDFFETLKTGWTRIESLELPSFYGLEDNLTVYKRH